MDLNKITAPDFTLLNQEELQQEYIKLHTKYLDIKLLNDENNQQIYELKRTLQTATAAESYLSQELELVLSSQSSEIENLKQKHVQEIDQLKIKYTDMTALTQTLEQNVEDLKSENTHLKQKVEKLEMQKPLLEMPVSEQNNERELKLEEENLELLAKIDLFQSNLNKSTMSMAEKERQIEILKEQVQCLEENLQSKRDELEEKTNLLECTQERMAEMNAELAILKSQPENDNRKGNSLFAEVDDQRQAMKRILASQKKSYQYMKKIYNESEHEIRRLKRENAAMHNELQACTSIFLSAEQMYKDKLNERILQLVKQNKGLEKRLAWTEEKLIELSNNKGVNWLDSMLTYCRNETRELKAQLHSCRMQKGTLESNLWNSLQELAKWRFEALRSRCIIINRENLLEENGIKFQNFTTRDFPISEKECEKATPRLILQPDINFSENTVRSHNVDEHQNIPERNTKTISENLNLKNENITENVNENVIKRSANVSACDSSQIKEIKCENKDEIQGNSLRYNDKCTRIPDNLIKENEIEVAERCHENNFIKNEVKDDCPFSIYEDTTQYLPIVKCSSATRDTSETKPHFDISVSEDTFRKLMEIGQENCASTSSHNDAENNTQLKESILPPSDTNFFQIYEDTTQNVPLRKASWAKSQCLVENDGGKQENKENYNSDNRANQIEEHCSSFDKHQLESRPTLKHPSILVKSRNFVIDEIDSKSVRFDASVNSRSVDGDKGNDKTYGKHIRTKPNVIIKHITVQSKPEKK